MACPHLKHSIINKSKGGSIIASASYNKREKMYDELEEKMKYPHTKAHDHVLTKMLLPDGAPTAYTDPSRIWNDLNKIESDKVAYKLIIPFQKELSFEQNLELAIELLNEEYVKKGHPVQIDVHRGKNGNDHLHAIAADRRLINGEWDNQKSETIYYKRGTVKELDKKGKVINPDAVILTLNDKIDTPKLKRKKLQYDKDGNIIMEKGWQELQYDANGKPLLDEKGYPVLVDIREPDYDPKTKKPKYSKNGNYLKPQFKKSSVKHSDISDIGNIARIRQTWERLQNEAYQKYNILDENGKIFTVDLRSYKEQNKDLPADQQLIPTRHVGYGMKSESMLNHNADAKAHNDLVKEIRAKARALKAEKEKLAQSENALAAMQQDKEKFYALLNPRQAYINIWTARYNELATQRKDYEYTVLRELQSGRKLNADRRNRIDRRNKRGNAAWNRLHRHDQLMKNVSDKIQSDTESAIDIATLAGKKFDTFTNKEIVSFIRTRYGYDTSTIAADVLERTHKDNTNALSGRDEKAPYYPKGNTNDIKLKQSIKAITGNPDIAAVTKEAFATWDKTPDEAPPKAIVDVLDSYHTAEEFYNSTLSGHKWNTVRLDRNYNPDKINHSYNNEIKEITIEENTAIAQNALQLSLSRNFLDEYTASLQTQATVAKEATDEAEREAQRKAEESARRAEQERLAEEARRNAWSRAEYDRLSAIRDNKFEFLRLTAGKAMAEVLYQERLAAYDAYQEYKEIKNEMDYYKDEWEKQYDKEDAAAKKKSKWSIYEYDPDRTVSNRYYDQYLKVKHKLEEKYPDDNYPAYAPEPDRGTCEREAKMEFSAIRPEVLKKRIVSLGLHDDEKVIKAKSAYEEAAAEAKAYWQKKPTDDPADGQNTQQTQKRSANTRNKDRKKDKGKGYSRG